MYNMQDAELRPLDSQLDAVIGGRNDIINFGGGYSWVFQYRDNGAFGAMWVCGPTQCVDVTPKK